MKQRRALSAVAIVFVVHGAISGSFATRVPWISGSLSLDAAWLGVALLCPALGALVATPVAAQLVARLGGRRTTAAAIITYSAALAVPAFMPHLFFLCASLLIMGLAAGVSDVAMKSQGHVLEAWMSRPIMSRLFGAWSLGTLAGAGLGTAASFAALDARLHLAWTAVALMVISGSVAFALPSSAVSRTPRVPKAERAKMGRPTPLLLGAVAIAFGASFVEGAAHSWSAVYITDITGGSAGASSLGFTGFVASMAAGRLFGDALVQRFGPVKVVQTGGLVALAGGAAVVIAREPALALAGFAAIGLGIAAIVPIAVSAAARAGNSPAPGITAVLAVVQLACMAAPGTVGGIASTASLPVAFGVAAALTVPVALLAWILRPGHTPTLAGDEEIAVADAAEQVEGLKRPAVGTVAMASVVPVTGTVLPQDVTTELPAASRDAHTYADGGASDKPVLVPA